MRAALPLLALLAVAGCVSAPKPAPPPRVAPPRPVAVATPAPLPPDWRDWPLTAGEWHYRRASHGSTAVFGIAPPAFAIRCDSAVQHVYLTRFVPTTTGMLTVRTSDLSRVLPFTIDGDPPSGSVTAVLSSTDPLLDAIAFSRGHWTVEQTGHVPLVLPAWAEVARVVEDCRN